MSTASILDITPDEYHAREGFSSTRAKTTLARSPLHAKSMDSRVPSTLLDRGTVIHRLVLGKGKEFKVGNYDNWTTKAAKQFRDETREQGLVPILADDFIAWGTAAESIRTQFADRGILLDGESECAIEWLEPTTSGPLTCKGMLDHVWINDGRILDLKVTENAGQDSIERRSEDLGYAIQAAAYTRALTALRPDMAGRIQFLFAFCEPEPPYAINVCQPCGAFREIGERRWLRAVNTWAQCVATNNWPAYGTGINFITPPPWALSKEEFAEGDL